MMTPIEILFLGTTFLSMATGVVLVIINPNRSINRMFALVLLAITMWFFGVFMVIREVRLYTPATHGYYIFWIRLSSAAAASLPWLIWMMMTTLAKPSMSLDRIFLRSWPWILMFGALGILSFTEVFMPSNAVLYTPRVGYGYPIYFFALLIQAVVVLLSGYRQMQHLDGARKIEMQFFVLNTSLACILVLFSTYLGRLYNLPLLSHSGPFIFVALYGITIWAITHHRVFDARQVIATIGLQVVYFGLLGFGAVGFTELLQRFIDTPFNILLAAIGAGLLATTCAGATRRWFGLDQEHRLREPRQTIIAWAREIPGAGQLKSHFENFLCDWCQTDKVELLIKRGPAFGDPGMTLPSDWPGLVPLCVEGWITPEFLQRRKAGAGTAECLDYMTRNQLGALLAVPPGSDSPSHMFAFGLKRSLRPYTYPDIRLLLDLAELMDNILTHATLSAHAARIAQMESAAMMSRSLAHDLNNLTTPVATYLLHAQGRAVPGSAEAEVYDAALHSVKVMHDYIRESLFFSRQLIPGFKAVDLAQTLTSVVRLCQERAARRDTTLELLCDKHVTLTADPVLFQRLAVNLVNNAIDASSPGGTVTLAIGTQGSEQITFKVSDQGVGIPPENLPRIFDPYFTTKDTGDTLRGLGLGLAICRKIADLHGATIEVNSLSGRGTTFTALFPKNGLPERSVREPRSAQSVNTSLVEQLGIQPRTA